MSDATARVTREEIRGQADLATLHMRDVTVSVGEKYPWNEVPVYISYFCTKLIFSRDFAHCMIKLIIVQGKLWWYTPTSFPGSFLYAKKRAWERDWVYSTTNVRTRSILTRNKLVEFHAKPHVSCILSNGDHFCSGKFPSFDISRLTRIVRNKLFIGVMFSCNADVAVLRNKDVFKREFNRSEWRMDFVFTGTIY